MVRDEIRAMALNRIVVGALGLDEMIRLLLLIRRELVCCGSSIHPWSIDFMVLWAAHIGPFSVN